MSTNYTDTADVVFSGLSRLNNTNSTTQVLEEATEIAASVFQESIVTIWDQSVNSCIATQAGKETNGVNTDTITEPAVESLRAHSQNRSGSTDSDTVDEPIIISRSQGPFQSELLAAIDQEYILEIGSYDNEAFDRPDRRIAKGLVTTVETTLQGLSEPETTTLSADTEPDQSRSSHDGHQQTQDMSALYQLHAVTGETDNHEKTLMMLLEQGCEYFGVERGSLSRIDESEYTIQAAIDPAETFETGQTLELMETLCASTIDPARSNPVAFVDIEQTKYRDHPATETVSAYIAAPVTVNGETYGTVNFSSETPRKNQFRSLELDFVALIAQWIGNEIERERQFEELQRYETVIEAIDDPMYALDSEGQFTFVNSAAEQMFGYGEDVIGDAVSVGMDQTDIDRMQHKIRELIDTDDRSATTEFEIETMDGDRRVVENRLSLIGDDDFQGSAGVLRDITDRVDERRQLNEFQRAIESAEDGVAVLDGGEYEYIDQTHIDMYGFDAKNQLLGETWQKLYDEAEIERLESEAFPKLESKGYWRGMVTGTRPDGSQFPAELSLTAVDGNRLVCTVRDETERRARQQELEQRLAAIEAAIDGIGLLDTDGEYTYINQAHADIYGYDSQEALIGNNWEMCYDDSERNRLMETAFDTLADTGSWRGEATGVREDGTSFPQEIALTKLDDGYICVVRDITERKARQQELELKERAMDEASVGIQITDATSKNNEIAYVNGGFERITGYTAEDALGHNPRFLQTDQTDSATVNQLVASQSGLEFASGALN